jgi:geranylgeranyl pyrophosphate synthase
MDSPGGSSDVDRLIEEYWSAEKRLVQQILAEDHLHGEYRRQVVGVLELWARPEGGDGVLATLPAVVCIACGGDLCQAVPVCAAWRLFRLAAKLFDDVEDGDVRHGKAEQVNVAVGLVFIGQLALSTLAERDVPTDRVSLLVHRLSIAGLLACGGQHTDLTADILDPDGWLQSARAKSGIPLGWGAWAGALVAGVGRGTADSYREYGCNLGVLLQVADDYNGVWHPDAASDLATGRPTLSVSYALSVASAQQRHQLQKLLGAAQEGEAEAEGRARDMLVALGAQAYLLVVGRLYRNRAAEALRRTSEDGPAKRQLLRALDRVFPALEADIKD